MGKQFAYIFFGIEFLGTIVALCKLVFYAGVATSGGLDLMGYEVPGLSETFFVLPIAFHTYSSCLCYLSKAKKPNIGFIPTGAGANF